MSKFLYKRGYRLLNSDVGTQLILPPIALLPVHSVIIVVRWGTLGRPAGNQRTLAGMDKWCHRKTSLRLKVVQEPRTDSIQNEYPLYCLSDAGHSKPIKEEVVVDGKPFTMELDTGATVSLVSESTYQEYWPDRQLQECNCKT